MNTQQINLSMSGQYMMQVKRSGIIINETPWFDNMILNSGLDNLGKEVNFLQYCFTGSGNSTVSANNTSLASKIETTSGSPAQYAANYSQYSNSGAPNYETTTDISYTFAQGEVVGNISEVGIGPNLDGTELFSRSLVTTSTGQPTSIAVTAMDELTITYRLKLKPNVNTTTGSFTIGGQTIGYSCMVGGAETFGHPILLIGGSFSKLVSGGSGGYAYTSSSPTLDLGTVVENNFVGDYELTTGYFSTSAIDNPYVNGSFRRTGALIWGPTQALDPRGIKGIIMQYGYSGANITYKYRFNTPIMKTNTQELRLNTTFTWGRG